jgi:hypothetical protein
VLSWIRQTDSCCSPRALTRPGDYDITEIITKGMGIAASRYRSRAARTAHELWLKGGIFGESTRTPAEQKLIAKRRAAIEVGKLDPNAVRADYKAGKLTECDAKTLMSDNQRLQLVRDFRRLSLEKALTVWDLPTTRNANNCGPFCRRKPSS